MAVSYAPRAPSLSKRRRGVIDKGVNRPLVSINATLRHNPPGDFVIYGVVVRE